MKQIIIIIIAAFQLYSCSGNKDQDSANYTLIRDNLYCDKSGNLYLKAIDRSLAEGGTTAENEKHIKDSWLFVVYCDTCKLMYSGENAEQIANKKPDGMTELRNVVDTATFRLVEIDSTENLIIYEDKNFTYYHHVMLDGGTISLGEKSNSTEISEMSNKWNDNSLNNPINFKKLQKYIIKNGYIEKVNASSRSDKPMYITYYIFEINNTKLTVDKTNRIYFSDKNNLHLGNILLSIDELSVSVEADDTNHIKLIESTYFEALKLLK